MAVGTERDQPAADPRNAAQARKGQLPLLSAAQKLQEGLLEGPSFGIEEDDSPLAEGKGAILCR